MARFPFNSERRRSQRYPVSEPRDEGELRLGDNRFSVLILNESAGGFAVAAENPSGIIQGEVGLLRAGKDWYQVRVTSLMPMPPPENAPPPDLDAIPYDAAASYAPPRKSKFRTAFRQKAQYRIGLRRLRDADNPDLKLWEVFRLLLALRLWEHFPRKGIAMLLGVLLLVLAVGTAAACFLIWSGRSGDVRSALENVEEKTILPLLGTETPVPKNPNSLDALRKKFAEVLRHSPGAVAFLEPEVSEELQLNELQQQAIRSIVEEVQKKIEELRQAIAPAEAPEEYARREKLIFDQARQKALRALTERQRDRWRALTGEDLPKEK
jgi:hypothetical protein